MDLARLALLCAVLAATAVLADTSADADRLARAVTLYASFDEEVRADAGGGIRTFSTRFGDPRLKEQFTFEKGFSEKAFRIAKGKGIAGGALECVDVLPRNGRIFFPAK